MYRWMKKTGGFLGALTMMSTMITPLYAQDENNSVVILHTNDVHCGGLIASKSDDGYSSVGYAGVEAAKKSFEETYGEDHVVLVDAGDAISGQPIGTLSKGEDIIEIMNEMGYDLAVPGNHEFDYGVQQLLDLAGMADFEYLSCNIENLETGENLFAPYAIETYTAGQDSFTVGYLGIATPVTLTSVSPATFENEQGELIYSFDQGDDGKLLYDKVQQTTDYLKNEQDVDYVIAIAHLGMPADSSLPEMYTSKAVIENTSGIDAMIDGHSHQIYNTTIENKDGQAISVSQCGMQLQAYGVLTIEPDGDPDPSDITSTLVIASEQSDIPQDPETLEFIEGIEERLDQKLDQVIGKNEVALSFLSADENGDPWWYTARMHETNLGDFVADAYRAATGAQIGFVNGGGVRWSEAVFAIEPGDLTYGNMIDINPYANGISLVKIKGQALIDALEYSVRYLTPAFDDNTEANGGFLQVSGISFEADVAIPSPIIEDESGNFEAIEGQRRVSNVLVDGQPIDPQAEYTVGTISFLLEGGSGYSMLRECEYIARDLALDYDTLIQYLQNDLDGVINEGYENPEGEGRITLLVGQTPAFEDVAPGAWYSEAIDYLNNEKIMTGYSPKLFGVDDPISRAQFITVLYRYLSDENYPAINETPFMDVGDDLYYTPAINWAYENGYTTGLDEDLFGVDTPVSLEQVTLMLYRIFGQEESVDLSILEDYQDVDEISEYALESVAWALSHDLIGGSDVLMPTADCSRARTAVILYNGIINDILVR